MSEFAGALSQIETLWNEHLDSPLPESDSDGDESGDADLYQLDTFIAGCVSTFIETGNLDVGRTGVLGLCYRDALVVQSLLKGNAREYASRLEKLAELVLRAVVMKNQF